MTGPSEGGRARSQRFDAFGLVRTRGNIEGTVDPFDLERVEESLGEEDGEIPKSEIAYRLDGELDLTGRAALNVALDGEVPLQCQRCLRTFWFPVHQRTAVLLARDEQELQYLDDHDEREVVLAAGPLDALEIVEDELVLSLPYVPRCDRPDCVAGDAAALTGQDAPAGSAFDVLAALKPGRKPGEE